MKFLVTGGAGFIGSALIRHLIEGLGHEVLNIDSLTYASNLESVSSVSHKPEYHFAQIDIVDQPAVEEQFLQFRPDGVFHLAAESHVDRSISGPDVFIRTNILGTARMLAAARTYYESGHAPESFRFIHVSTDEVYGELSADGHDLFTEQTPYDPRSPYAASKASSDHLVRAWINTYKLPALITNCSNNYGPFQTTDKLIPLAISHAIKRQKIPVYGRGEQIRDWLFVKDHVRGLIEVFLKGELGQSYNIGGHNEKMNIDVVNAICTIMDELKPIEAGSEIRRYADLIEFVADRPGHDFRYAIDASKMQRDLGWAPEETFNSGLRKTVEWYVDYLSDQTS
ncbi:MAG: dTDP-glucose 4,6-dehydratase [Sphingopyxis sp.]|nr:MAG: dTDP-glucose 4,6-dehydratase [Sphingopyxis sp.]